jgi:hypothetical protein
MRLALGLFFLVAGVGLLVLRLGFPEVVARYDPTYLLIGALMALVLAGLNIAKWYAGWLWYQQQATPVRRPLQPDPSANAEDEFNPEFDFSKRTSSNDKPANS